MFSFMVPMVISSVSFYHLDIIKEQTSGGALENRMRFLLEIFKGVRKEVGNSFPIGVKLNSADFMKAGFSEEEALQVIKTLDQLGIDLIEISGVPMKVRK